MMDGMRAALNIAQAATTLIEENDGPKVVGCTIGTHGRDIMLQMSGFPAYVSAKERIGAKGDVIFGQVDHRMIKSFVTIDQWSVGVFGRTAE